MNQQSAAQLEPPQQQYRLQETQQQHQVPPGSPLTYVSYLELSKKESAERQQQQSNIYLDTIHQNQHSQPLESHRNYSTRIEPSQSQPVEATPMKRTFSPRPHLWNSHSPSDRCKAASDRALTSFESLDLVSYCFRPNISPDKAVASETMLAEEAAKLSLAFQDTDSNVTIHLPFTAGLEDLEGVTWATCQQRDSSAIIESAKTSVEQQYPPNLSVEQASRSLERQSPNGDIESEGPFEQLHRITLTRDDTLSAPKIVPSEHASAPNSLMRTEMDFDMLSRSDKMQSQQDCLSGSSLSLSGDASISSSPELSVNIHFQDVPTSGSADLGYLNSPTRLSKSPQQKSLPVLTLDATIEDNTRVLDEEVQAYIGQFDRKSRRWSCLYPKCSKTSKRRGNVYAHVQTHLGKRDFKCDQCVKCFVRWDDLKRHISTHSDFKIHSCRCGTRFTRQDGLKRHRKQRICDKGLENVAKKTAKRGRPLKKRSSCDNRAKKATRKRATKKSYAPSVSLNSETSFSGPSFFSPSKCNSEADRVQMLAGLTASPPSAWTPQSSNHSSVSSLYTSEAIESPKKATFAASDRTSSSTKLEKNHMQGKINEMEIVRSREGSLPGLWIPNHESSFNSSVSDESMNIEQLSPIIGFEHFSSVKSPIHVTTPWDESNFFDFGKNATETSDDTFLTTNFEDNIRFFDIDNIENY